MVKCINCEKVINLKSGSMSYDDIRDLKASAATGKTIGEALDYVAVGSLFSYEYLDDTTKSKITEDEYYNVLVPIAAESVSSDSITDYVRTRYPPSRGKFWPYLRSDYDWLADTYDDLPSDLQDVVDVIIERHNKYDYIDRLPKCLEKIIDDRRAQLSDKAEESFNEDVINQADIQMRPMLTKHEVLREINDEPAHIAEVARRVTKNNPDIYERQRRDVSSQYAQKEIAAKTGKLLKQLEAEGKIDYSEIDARYKYFKKKE